MKAAIVQGAGQAPAYADFAEPRPAADERLIRVSAAAISHVSRSRAAGRHYSSSANFPFVVGVDGVGQLEDGSRVYFALPRPPNGSMAEQTAAPATQCLALPDELDDVTAAAIVNPGMSSWAAYKERALLKPGETVLVNGATGAAGRLAVQIAKHFGAKKVIATGRNIESLQALEAIGADATIPLIGDETALETRFGQEFAAGVDVVVDYLWGRSAERLLIAAAKAGEDGVPLRFIQIGAVTGPNITLPSEVLRASAIQLMGSGIGSVPRERFIEAASGLLQAAVPAGLRIGTRPIPLSQIAAVWSETDSTRRTVLTVNG